MRGTERFSLKWIGVFALIGASGVGCNGNSGTSTASTGGNQNIPACANCSSITPENFVAALVSLAQSGQIPAAYAGTTLVKTDASSFIIWNGETQTYMDVAIGDAVIDNNCKGPGDCANINPQSAALAFADDGTKPYYVSANGTITYGEPETIEEPQAGTYISDTFGSGAGNIGIYDNTITAYNVTPIAVPGSLQGVLTAPAFELVFSYEGTPMRTQYYSTQSHTKDVDLQAARLQGKQLLRQAAQLSAGLQMDFEPALQLAQVAQTIQRIQASGAALTGGDRAAITKTLLGMSGITQDQIDHAVQGGLKGDMTGANSLVDQLSKNLGMPQNTLRDRVLPMLGVDMN